MINEEMKYGDKKGEGWIKGNNKKETEEEEKLCTLVSRECICN